MTLNYEFSIGRIHAKVYVESMPTEEILYVEFCGTHDPAHPDRIIADDLKNLTEAVQVVEQLDAWHCGETGTLDLVRRLQGIDFEPRYHWGDERRNRSFAKGRKLEGEEF